MFGFGKTTIFNSHLGNRPNVFCWASDYLIWSSFWSPEKDISRIWRLGDRPFQALDCHSSSKIVFVDSIHSNTQHDQYIVILSNKWCVNISGEQAVEVSRLSRTYFYYYNHKILYLCKVLGFNSFFLNILQSSPFPVRQKMKAKPLNNSFNTTTSGTARKILETLEKMTTPLGVSIMKNESL
jgi:hypothetical protein